jgi:hypothetical protein
VEGDKDAGGTTCVTNEDRESHFALIVLVIPNIHVLF